MVKSYRTPSQFIPTVYNKYFYNINKIIIFACSKLKKNKQNHCVIFILDPLASVLNTVTQKLNFLVFLEFSEEPCL